MGRKEEMDRNTVIVSDFNILWNSMDRSSREKISKDTVALNYALHQMDLIDILRTFHLKAEYAC